MKQSQSSRRAQSTREPGVASAYPGCGKGKGNPDIAQQTQVAETLLRVQGDQEDSSSQRSIPKWRELYEEWTPWVLLQRTTSTIWCCHRRALGLCCGVGFETGPENFHMPWEQSKTRKKKIYKIEEQLGKFHMDWILNNIRELLLILLGVIMVLWMNRKLSLFGEIIVLVFYGSCSKLPQTVV